ncbi:VIN3-like protein 1 [Impatiens glandulifera]|uniref:VIN3-like protein 1 n=1 Tax=Impatiens glandulifera TaxID=253017 RepID=UPI001FB0825F|nr:VIN3-like protein 1 [Impatiens glandulifera]
MTELSQKTSKKNTKSTEPKKLSSSPKEHLSRKHQRKGGNPVRIPIPIPNELSPDTGHQNSWVCKNSACRATLSIEDTFCKRCSCCICHLFDDNKDPSLWLECSSEYDKKDSCGLSCHIECAFQCKKVGVVNLGQLMQLDGSYCCASCGKVSGIIGCWKKQLNVAKDARRVDILCYRILLSYRLLVGTSKFKEMHEIVNDAKAKLETEVGPVDGVSSKMARGIVSRLSVGAEVQKLCSLALEKAEEWFNSNLSEIKPSCREGSLPAACKFLFEEVTSTSVVIVLLELCNGTSEEEIKGYKLWYCKSRDEIHAEEPISIFPRSQRKILISNLQPCTEYSFRIISYTDVGDLGHSEAKYFTKSVEIILKNPNPNSDSEPNKKDSSCKMETDSDTQKESTGFKVRDLGKILNRAWAQEQVCFDGLPSFEPEECCGICNSNNNNNKLPETLKDQSPSVSRRLDLNVASVPDLNEEAAPPFESSRDEDNWTHIPNREVPAVNSRSEVCGKRTNEDIHDSDSTLIHGSPFSIKNELGSLDENFEYCVKIIRWLECEGHIKQEFRLKLLTWFSLRSTEQGRRVVNTFIQTLIDDPNSLAAQLVDSFTDIVSNKRPRNGFCSKLWH